MFVIQLHTQISVWPTLDNVGVCITSTRHLSMKFWCLLGCGIVSVCCLRHFLIEIFLWRLSHCCLWTTSVAWWDAWSVSGQRKSAVLWKDRGLHNPSKHSLSLFFFVLNFFPFRVTHVAKDDFLIWPVLLSQQMNQRFDDLISVCFPVGH